MWDGRCLRIVIPTRYSMHQRHTFIFAFSSLLSIVAPRRQSLVTTSRPCPAPRSVRHDRRKVRTGGGGQSPASTARAIVQWLLHRPPSCQLPMFGPAATWLLCRYRHKSYAVGAPKRLNRKLITEAAPFGSPTYSFEEMIAEMSAASLCAEGESLPVVVEN